MVWVLLFEMGRASLVHFVSWIRCFIKFRCFTPDRCTVLICCSVKFQCTILDLLQSREMTKQIGGQGNHYKWLVSQKILNVEELETLVWMQSQGHTQLVAWKREA